MAQVTRGGLRLETPERTHFELVPSTLDDLLQRDHKVRAIWRFVETLDLGPWLQLIKAVEGGAGRPAIDPRLLVALWIFAASEGVGSARYLAELCERDLPFRWLCGHVSVNHHTLSDFKVKHGEKLDALLAQVLGVLQHHGVIDLDLLAQDGVKVRAHAGAGSFRRKQTLEESIELAKERLKALAKELEESAGTAKAKHAAARLQRAKQQADALAKALAEFPEVEAQRAREAVRNKKRAEERKPPRVSTTDPEARIMRMPDGGFRPAYNVQLTSSPTSGVIVAMRVTKNGTDYGEAQPLLKQILERLKAMPARYLLDGGYVRLDDIDELTQMGTKVFAPVPAPRDEGVDRFSIRETDSEEVAAWRTRMSTEEGKQTYALRSQAERINADFRQHRGLTRFNVVGLEKVTSVMLWLVIAHNIGLLLQRGLI